MAALKRVTFRVRETLSLLFLGVSIVFLSILFADAQSCLEVGVPSAQCNGQINCRPGDEVCLNDPSKNKQGYALGIQGKSCTVTKDTVSASGTCCGFLKCKATLVDGKEPKTQEQIQSEAEKKAAEQQEASQKAIEQGGYQPPQLAETQSPLPATTFQPFPRPVLPEGSALNPIFQNFYGLPNPTTPLAQPSPSGFAGLNDPSNFARPVLYDVNPNTGALKGMSLGAPITNPSLSNVGQLSTMEMARMQEQYRDNIARGIYSGVTGFQPVQGESAQTLTQKALQAIRDGYNNVVQGMGNSARPDVQGDAVQMARQLGFSEADIARIQAEVDAQWDNATPAQREQLIADALKVAEASGQPGDQSDTGLTAPREVNDIQDISMFSEPDWIPNEIIPQRIQDAVENGVERAQQFFNNAETAWNDLWNPPSEIPADSTLAGQDELSPEQFAEKQGKEIDDAQKQAFDGPTQEELNAIDQAGKEQYEKDQLAREEAEQRQKEEQRLRLAELMRNPTWPGGASPYLAQQRAALMAELDTNKALRDKVTALLEWEKGGAGDGSKQAILESMLNRSIQRGYTSLNQALNDGFYGPINRGQIDPYVARGLSSNEYREANAVIEAVRGGSNVCNFCTDQGMRNEIIGPKWQVGTEWFGHMAGSPRWANAQRAAQVSFDASYRGFSSPTVSINPGSFDLGPSSVSWDSYQPIVGLDPSPTVWSTVGETAQILAAQQAAADYQQYATDVSNPWYGTYQTNPGDYSWFGSPDAVSAASLGTLGTVDDFSPYTAFDVQATQQGSFAWDDFNINGDQTGVVPPEPPVPAIWDSVADDVRPYGEWVNERAAEAREALATAEEYTRYATDAVYDLWNNDVGPYGVPGEDGTPTGESGAAESPTDLSNIVGSEPVETMPIADEKSPPSSEIAAGDPIRTDESSRVSPDADAQKDIADAPPTDRAPIDEDQRRKEREEFEKDLTGKTNVCQFIESRGESCQSRSARASLYKEMGFTDQYSGSTAQNQKLLAALKDAARNEYAAREADRAQETASSDLGSAGDDDIPFESGRRDPISMVDDDQPESSDITRTTFFPNGQREQVTLSANGDYVRDFVDSSNSSLGSESLTTLEDGTKLLRQEGPYFQTDEFAGERFEERITRYRSDDSVESVRTVLDKDVVDGNREVVNHFDQQGRPTANVFSQQGYEYTETLDPESGETVSVREVHPNVSKEGHRLVIESDSTDPTDRDHVFTRMRLEDRVGNTVYSIEPRISQGGEVTLWGSVPGVEPIQIASQDQIMHYIQVEVAKEIKKIEEAKP